MSVQIKNITFPVPLTVDAISSGPDLYTMRIDALVVSLLSDGSYDALTGAMLFADKASPEVSTKVREAVDAYKERAALFGWAN